MSCCECLKRQHHDVVSVASLPLVACDSLSVSSNSSSSSSSLASLSRSSSRVLSRIFSISMHSSIRLKKKTNFVQAIKNCKYVLPTFDKVGCAESRSGQLSCCHTCKIIERATFLHGIICLDKK